MMNTLKIAEPNPLKGNAFRRPALRDTDLPGGKMVNYQGYMLVAVLLLLWAAGQHLIIRNDPSTGFIDPNIWLLCVLGLIAFVVVTGLCWWLLQKFWMSMGLPALGNMVLQFKDLAAWQQLGFYWASFGLLLWAAVGVLTAIL